MFEILSFIFGVLVGFAIGFLVYRNNKKRFEKNEENLRAMGEKLKEEAKRTKDRLKGD